MTIRRIACFVLVLLGLLVTSSHTIAQGPSPEVRITNVDASQFPTVRVRVAPILQEPAAATNLTKDNFVIYEDGTAVSSLEGVTPVWGARVAIFLDASASMAVESQTHSAREAIAYLIAPDPGNRANNKWFSPNQENDWLMMMAPLLEGQQPVRTYRTIQPWKQNGYNDIDNMVQSFNFQEYRDVSTPLYAILAESMRELKSDIDYPKFMLVISDGGTSIKTPSENIAKAIERAIESHVTFLSLQIPPANDSTSERLDEMARKTGGDFVRYRGPSSLDPLYNIIRSRRVQYEVVYRSSIKKAGQHSLQVGVVWGGEETKSAPQSFLPPVVPPEVHIVEPVSPDKRVEVKVIWADGQEHDIVKKTYVIEGEDFQSAITRSPDEAFILSSLELEEGVYALYAEVEDERGIVGVSDRVEVRIESPPSQGLSPVAGLVIIALAVIVIAVVVWLADRRRRTHEKRKEKPEGEVEAEGSGITEIGPPPHRARAYLIPINKDGSHGDEIQIKFQTVYLARNPVHPDSIPFSDRSVSRKQHARIEERNGDFTIYDEGSTSGTYVNYEQVSDEGYRLTDGDTIHLGRVELLFQEPDRTEVAPPPELKPEEKDKETEPYSPGSFEDTA